MNFAGEDSRIFDQFDYIKNLVQRMNSANGQKFDPAAMDAFHCLLTDGFGTWINLLPSFSSVALQTTSGPWLSVKDWNPFSQQLPVYFTKTTNRPLENDFHFAQEVVSNFHLTFHEGVHIALWEPFFLGEYGVDSHERFCADSLIFEAAAFWFTDCVTAPALRKALPDVELVRNRFAVTNDFLPYRALKDAGIKTERDGFDVYQLAFTGFDTAIWKSESLYATAIARRLYGFYSSSLIPLKQLYKSLDSIGVFDEFFERFTRPGLPSIFSKKVRDRLLRDGSEEFAWSLLRKNSTAWQKLDESQLKAIRVRRGIQGRAYKSLSVRYALADNRCFGHRKSWTEKNNSLAIEQIGSYLNSLEVGLGILASGKVNATIRHIELADQNFEKVRVNFKSHDLRTGMRDFILPGFAGKARQFGRPPFLKGRRKDLVPKEIEAVLDLLLQAENGSVTKDPARLKLACDIAEELAAKDGRIRSKKSRANLNKLIDRALVHPAVLPRWSVSLASFVPENGYYTEPTFKYD